MIVVVDSVDVYYSIPAFNFPCSYKVVLLSTVFASLMIDRERM